VEVFDIFLSRNSVDKPAVEGIAHKLRDAGVEPWLDKWYLVPGKTFQSGLADALRSCPTCAVFIGPKGVGDWAREEVLVAQDRAAKEADYRLIPILLPSVPDPFDYSELPPSSRSGPGSTFAKVLTMRNRFARSSTRLKESHPAQMVCMAKPMTPAPIKG